MSYLSFGPGSEDAEEILRRAFAEHPPMTDEERAAAIRKNLGVREPEVKAGGDPFSADVILYVHEGFFWVDGAHPDAPEYNPTDYRNRLFGLSDSGVFVFTGLNTGRVPIRVEATREEPPVPEGDWVGEASIRSIFGTINVTSFDDYADVPSAAVGGPGHYRVRIAGRGRELHFDAVSDDLDETYVVQVCAAPVMLAEPQDS
ncbi:MULTISPECIES: hypothetical protein [unclassified Leifsonia]|uniref:hypothetical protein n=1 Tax=unclassified Leifsonia TaxID=2663824 RepID=UPI0006FD6C26|nr:MULTISPECIES: hypothetical protein [unclassified Leifsonia]KQX08172.1 hypothetical protein ASC59_10940 [Leifsonia sp. Root1293]KRA12454.1 hypothetical protein ASD61_10940 [Leifsonia sp. Root60]